MDNIEWKKKEMATQLLIELYDSKDQDGWRDIGEFFSNIPKSLWNQVAADLYESGYIEFPGENNKLLARITPLGMVYLDRIKAMGQI